ncbi:MAG: peptide-methionine (S)-S-oxide reductase [Candidatus Saliniplasma sp.]
MQKSSYRYIILIIVAVLLVSTVIGFERSRDNEGTENVEIEGLVIEEIPKIDNERPEDYRTSTFAVWCFWAPEARVGVVDGVISTRVGFIEVDGSVRDDRRIVREAIQVDYDPDKITYMELYNIIQETGEIKDMHPFGVFKLAPWNRQNYYLRGHENLTEAYQSVYPHWGDFINSTATSRINGYLIGFGQLGSPEDLQHLGLTEKGREEVYEIWESERKMR